jgi:hypothetical protein
MGPFTSFDEFYSLYMQHHRNVWNRRVHLLGWVLGVCIGLLALTTGRYMLILLAPLPGLGAIWLGHWVLEPTHAIEFKHPLLTARANLRMFRQMLTGALPF